MDGYLIILICESVIYVPDSHTQTKSPNSDRSRMRIVFLADPCPNREYGTLIKL